LIFLLRFAAKGKMYCSFFFPSFGKKKIILVLVVEFFRGVAKLILFWGSVVVVGMLSLLGDLNRDAEDGCVS